MRRPVAAGIVIAMAAACAPVSPAEVAVMSLENGAAINTIAAPHGKSVVLVISPADCVSCDTDLARWLSQGRDSSTQVAVVLTREPTADEQRQLAMLRLPVSGQVESGKPARRIPAPCVLQFDDGKSVSATCAHP